MKSMVHMVIIEDLAFLHDIGRRWRYANKNIKINIKNEKLSRRLMFCYCCFGDIASIETSPIIAEFNGRSFPGTICTVRRLLVVLVSFQHSHFCHERPLIDALLWKRPFFGERQKTSLWKCKTFCYGRCMSSFAMENHWTFLWKSKYCFGSAKKFAVVVQQFCFGMSA